MGRAASVDIYFSTTPQTGPYWYSLRIDAAEGVSVAGINFVVVGFTELEIDLPANPAVSPPDSVFVPEVLGDQRAAVVINAILGQTLATGPASQVPLATLYPPYFCEWECVAPLELHDHPSYFGGTVVGTDGSFLDYELHLDAAIRHVPYPSPEPAAVLLAGLTLLRVVRARRRHS
jgi:hypothetical protein